MASPWTHVSVAIFLLGEANIGSKNNQTGRIEIFPINSIRKMNTEMFIQSGLEKANHILVSATMSEKSRRSK